MIGFFLHVLKSTGNKLLTFIIKRKEMLLVRVLDIKIITWIHLTINE